MQGFSMVFIEREGGGGGVQDAANQNQDQEDGKKNDRVKAIVLIF